MTGPDKDPGKVIDATKQFGEKREQVVRETLTGIDKALKEEDPIARDAKLKAALEAYGEAYRPIFEAGPTPREQVAQDRALRAYAELHYQSEALKARVGEHVQKCSENPSEQTLMEGALMLEETYRTLLGARKKVPLNTRAYYYEQRDLEEILARQVKAGTLSPLAAQRIELVLELGKRIYDTRTYEQRVMAMISPTPGVYGFFDDQPTIMKDADAVEKERAALSQSIVEMMYVVGPDMDAFWKAAQEKFLGQSCRREIFDALELITRAAAPTKDTQTLKHTLSVATRACNEEQNLRIDHAIALLVAPCVRTLPDGLARVAMEGIYVPTTFFDERQPLPSGGNEMEDHTATYLANQRVFYRFSWETHTSVLAHLMAQEETFADALANEYASSEHILFNLGPRPETPWPIDYKIAYEFVRGLKNTPRAQLLTKYLE